MTPGRDGGFISLFTRHPTAANLLMALMVIGGLIAFQRINTQFFPDFGLDIISISVEWPGASAEDLDETVVQAIEPEVRFLDGVKRVFSDSFEGSAFIIIEYDPGTDMQSALNTVETVVGQVTTLPEDSETPVIKRTTRYDPISRIVVSGPFPEPALKAYAKKIRDDLLERGVDKVDLIGARDEEIWAEIAPETLRRLDLTISDISQRIADTSKDLPSGGTQGAASNQIRSLGLVKTAEGIAGIEVKAFDDGRKILLGDIANVSETYKDGQVELLRNGQRAIELFVQRSLTADALEVADVVADYLAEIEGTLPPDLKVEQYDITADLIRSRLSLLLENGGTGLILVLAVLFLFLNFRVGFWVAVGIPVSLLATMVLMLATGQTINMISMFALIMVIGIVVDDAIVVGEHAETRWRNGLPPVDAAEVGARRMAVPVLASSMTTIAAFAPLLMVTDIIGKLITAIPYVAIVVILASLVECFFVLPGHMRHALNTDAKKISAFRVKFNAAFDRFRNGLFHDALVTAVRWRYATLAIAVSAFIICLGLVIGGRVGFHFFVSPEADKAYANLSMVSGTSRADTMAALTEIERAMVAAEAELTNGQGGVIKFHETKIGGKAVRDLTLDVTGDNTGAIVVELVPSDEREVRTEPFLKAWREGISLPAGLDSLTVLAAQTGPPGKDLDIRISGDDIFALKQAAGEVVRLVQSYPGTSSVVDDLPYGKEETILEVTPRGKALGFTTETVGRQVRNAYEGSIAKRFPRDDEEVVVRVQFPRDRAESGSLADFHLRAANGAEVALSEVVSLRAKQGLARVRREDGSRRVAVTAELDKTQISTDEIIESLERDGIADIAARYGAKIEYAGKAEEQARTFADMRLGALIGLCAIYIILAWVFGNYSQPLVVMSIIPMGFVGMTLGHLLLGYDITILSFVALIGLSGIVVNDSIILVSTIKEHLDQHEDKFEAIVNGAKERLRAVILTSATTIGGLTPLLFETSLQAQFLIPMALTITFGLMAATLLVLLVIPALLAIIEDFAILKRSWFAKEKNAPAE